MKVEEKITGIQRLSDLLNCLNPTQKEPWAYEACIRKSQLLPEEYASYLLWDKEKATKNLISKTEIFELFVTCLNPGQRLDFQLKDNATIWTKVIEGSAFVESVFQTNPEWKAFDTVRKSITTASTGMVLKWADKQSASLVNKSNERVIMLHLRASFRPFVNGKHRLIPEVISTQFNYDSINGIKI